jgi:hypothetical protein
MDDRDVLVRCLEHLDREAARERERRQWEEDREAERERERLRREEERRWEDARDERIVNEIRQLQAARTAHVSSIGERDYRAVLDQEDVQGALLRMVDNIVVHGPTIEEDGDDQVGQNFTWLIDLERENEDAHIVEFYNGILGAIQQSIPANFHLYNVRANNEVIMELNIEDPRVSVRGRTDFVLMVGGPDEAPRGAMMSRAKLFIEAKPSREFHAEASDRQAVTELILGNRLSVHEVTVVLTSGDHWRFYQLDRIRNIVDGVETAEWWAMYENVEGWAQGLARLRYLVHEPPAPNRFRIRVQLAHRRQGAAGGGANGGGADGAVAGGGPGAPAAANDDNQGADGGGGNVNPNIRGPVGGGGAGAIEAADDQPNYCSENDCTEDESVDLEWEYACAVHAVNRMPMFQGKY